MNINSHWFERLIETCLRSVESVQQLRRNKSEAEISPASGYRVKTCSSPVALAVSQLFSSEAFVQRTFLAMVEIQ